jgi:hypothetical protein
VKHTLATLEFEDVEGMELDGFGPQNVLDGLLLEEVSLAAGPRSRSRCQRATAWAGGSAAET